MAMPVLSAACPADADPIRALMVRAIAHSVTQDDALLADTLANVSQACAGRSPKSALLLNAAPNAVGFYERLSFIARESKQPLPPGFRAMQRRLPA